MLIQELEPFSLNLFYGATIIKEMPQIIFDIIIVKITHNALLNMPYALPMR
jgi:hypothetical protein